jgi:hypothetical protein
VCFAILQSDFLLNFFISELRYEKVTLKNYVNRFKLLIRHFDNAYNMVTLSVWWLLVLVLTLAKSGFPTDITDNPDDPEGSSQTIDYTAESSRTVKVNCSQGLLPGQFLCNEAAHVDPRTQQLIGNIKTHRS